VLLELLGLLEVQVVTEEVQPLVLRSDYLQVAVAVGVVELFQQLLGQVVEEEEQQLQPHHPQEEHPELLIQQEQLEVLDLQVLQPSSLHITQNLEAEGGGVPLQIPRLV
jgi:hypothetical protein